MILCHSTSPESTLKGLQDGGGFGCLATFLYVTTAFQQEEMEKYALTGGVLKFRVLHLYILHLLCFATVYDYILTN